MKQTKTVKKPTTNWLRPALWTAGAAGLAFALIQLVGPSPTSLAARSTQVPERAETNPARISPFGTMRNPGDTALETLGGWLSPSKNTSADADPSPLSTMSPPLFAADKNGQLILNTDTHSNLEKLLLQDTPQALQTQLKEVSQDLPKPAAQQLKTLVANFQQYATALSQSMPPGEESATEQEGLRILDRMHALRATYLGAETAQALFGEEEATARKLLALMQAQNDPNLSLDEKAQRAQEALSTMVKPSAEPKR
jgi:hypothetical protein